MEERLCHDASKLTMLEQVLASRLEEVHYQTCTSPLNERRYSAGICLAL